MKNNAAKSKFKVFIDGASRGNPGNSGIGILLIDQNGEQQQIKKFLGTRTNNQAEYMALITALETFKKPGGNKLDIYTDSQLVAHQINGIWKVKDPDIAKLHAKARKLIINFSSVTIQHIPRKKNSEADSLANEAIDEYLNQ